ncbi:MAG: hypothetical protein WAW39_29310 [Prosthecobacter sp.]|uniref:hypothetical protein n=1 Tax=Prosthecobacter sp. TaxID=1965333 RepID=UPI003BB15892
MRSKPKEIELLVTGLQPWEMEAWDGFTLLEDGLAFDPETARAGAEIVARVVADQLAAGNRNVLKSLELGYSKLRRGERFWPHQGKTPSSKLISVFVAFNHLRISGGIKRPSQVQVRAYLLAKGFPISKQEVSSHFKMLKLKKQSRDARETGIWNSFERT